MKKILIALLALMIFMCAWHIIDWNPSNAFLSIVTTIFLGYVICNYDKISD